MWRFLPLFVLGFACSQSSIQNRSEEKKTVEGQSPSAFNPIGEVPYSQVPNTDIESQPVHIIKAGSEAAVAPQVVTGSYLNCSQGLSSDALKATVSCSLVDLASNKNIAMTEFASHTWSLIASTEYTAVYKELPSSGLFQVIYEISSAVKPIVLADLAFRLDVVSKTGEKLGMQSALSLHRVHWAANNAGAIPAGAIDSGSEENRGVHTYPCRIVKDGLFFYGKLKSNDSICYSGENNLTIASHNAATKAQIYPSEILLLDAGTQYGDTLFWVDSGTVDPKLQFTDGVDDQGRALYPCRTSDPGNPDYENIPGHYEPENPNNCAFPLGDTDYATPNYQVLQWQTEAMKASYGASILIR